MKILMISTDEKILVDGSSVRKRMMWYSGACDELHIIVISRPGFYEEQVEDLPLWIWPTNSFTKWLGWWDAFRVAKQVFSAENESVSSELKQSHGGFLVTTQDELAGIAGFLIKKRYKIPWQAQIHSDITSPFFSQHSFTNKLRIIVARLIFSRATCLRFVSLRIQTGIAKWRRLKKISFSILPVYAQLSKYINIGQEKMGLSPVFDFAVLMVSRLTPEKNIDLALEALADIIKEKPQTSLIVVGEGPEQSRLEKQAQALNLGAHVSFEGWKEDLTPYFRASDMYLLTSWYEGCGLAVMEAMAAGLPVVMTDVGIAGDIVKDGESGLIVPVGSKDAITKAILQLINNEETYRTIRENALRVAQGLLTEKDYLEKLRESWSKC